MLLDEPTSQLDPVAGDELIWLLRRLNQEWETTVVLVEHRLERCLAAADRVIALQDGRDRLRRRPERASWSWAAAAAPALQTPAARLFALAGLQPAADRRQAGARDAARARPAAATPRRRAGAAPAGAGSARRRRAAGARRAGRRCELRGVWHELRDGPAILRGVDAARLRAGETVALMGRNGAGKSTLLRHAAGLLEPTRGRVRAAGRVALLLQNPGDYFIHERVARGGARARRSPRPGSTALAERNPRDLSGGERQRLALAIVPAATASRRRCSRSTSRRAAWTARPRRRSPRELRARADAGQAVIVATHDAGVRRRAAPSAPCCWPTAA